MNNRIILIVLCCIAIPCRMLSMFEPLVDFHPDQGAEAARFENADQFDNLDQEGLQNRLELVNRVIDRAHVDIPVQKRMWQSDCSMNEIVRGVRDLFSFPMVKFAVTHFPRICRACAFYLPRSIYDRGRKNFIDISWARCCAYSVGIGLFSYLYKRSRLRSRVGKNRSPLYRVMAASKNTLRVNLDERNQLYQQLYRRYAAEEGARAGERRHTADLQRRHQADHDAIARLQQEARAGQREIRQAELRAAALRQIEREHPELQAAH